MSNIYLIYVRDPVPDADAVPDAVMLEVGLYLVRTSQTRSQLYHAIKRRLAPRQLLVASLSAVPKFKGMRKGTTKHANALFGEEVRLDRTS